MTDAMQTVLVDGVWKKFRRGEHHDSLRDLIPALARRALRRPVTAADHDALKHDEFWVLRDVEFSLNRGEALGIIGHNGAGKSTMLKVLTRLLRPDRGAVGLRGRVGALIEVGSGFHLDLTGRENVFLNGTILGMRRQEVERRLEAIVEFAGIGPFIDTPVKRYSSGMAARLGFAVAAHLEPDVLIVDEVLSVGDFTFQGRCIQWMHEVLRNGTTVIFVSHNMDSVLSLCDRALLLNRGEVKYLGRPDDAVARYYAAGGTWTPVMDAQSKARTVSFTVDGLPERGTVEPGTRLHCVQRIDASEDCVVSPGIIVSKDSHVLMTTTVGRLAGEPLALRAGERREVHWDFTANLPAGAYDLGHHVESVTAGEPAFYDYDARARVMVVADRPGVQSTHFLDVAVGVMQPA